MIRILLTEQLAKKRWRQADLARATGIRPTTIGNLCNEQASQINFEQLDLICAMLDCDVSDILIHEAESTTREERASALYALARGAYIRLLQHEQSGDAAEAQRQADIIDAYALVARGFFGTDPVLFWRTLKKSASVKPHIEPVTGDVFAGGHNRERGRRRNDYVRPSGNQ